MQTELSMLDRFHYRLKSQHACFAWVFEQMADMPGPVFELGLGKGRTYDHLRRNQPGREIYVFERDVRPIEGCLPPDPYLVRGDIEVNLPVYVKRFEGKVALVHSDVGDISLEHNQMMRELVPRIAPPALMPGGFLLSDLNLEVPGFVQLPLPPDAVPGRYYIYRKPLTADS
jgi:S-adenosyl-L-methionine methyltransferase